MRAMERLRGREVRLYQATESLHISPMHTTAELKLEGIRLTRTHICEATCLPRS